jgi:RNA polymerase sigma factor (sigma-70 family)
LSAPRRRLKLVLVTEALTADAVAKLVGNHREFLGFLEKRLGDRALAEDVLQDAFVRGLPKLTELEQEESALAWFYRLLRNAVNDHYRRGGANQRKLAAFATELEAQSSSEADVAGEVCRCVATLASTLKPEYAGALQRVELDGVSVKDYASEQGITAGNAAVRVFRAREALRKQVAKSCGTCAEHGCLDCSCEPLKSCGHT